MLPTLGRDGNDHRVHEGCCGRYVSQRNKEASQGPNKEGVMKVGDLIMFRLCSEKGKLGIIMNAPREERFGPGTGVYRVFYDNGIAFFTGNQLVLQ